MTKKTAALNGVAGSHGRDVGNNVCTNFRATPLR